MNQSNRDFLAIYRNIFLFISENEEMFYVQINESDDDSETPFYAFQIYLKANIVPFYPLHLKMEFLVSINFDELKKAYESLDEEQNLKYLKDGISKSPGFLVFMEREWYNVIMYLKEFNQVNDNYNEIAKLLHKYRGAIVGTNLGV